MPSKDGILTVPEAKRCVPIKCIITDASAVKFLRAAAAWKNIHADDYVKQALTDLLRSLHEEVEQTFNSRQR
jgi:hypothetical protein